MKNYIDTEGNLNDKFISSSNLITRKDRFPKAKLSRIERTTENSEYIAILLGSGSNKVVIQERKNTFSSISLPIRILHSPQELNNELLEFSSFIEENDNSLDIYLVKTKIRNLLEKYKLLALKAIWNLYQEEKIDKRILSRFLSVLGESNLGIFNPYKAKFLTTFCKVEEIELRHSAIDGISKLNINESISLLKERSESETNVVLKKLIFSYLEQLNKLK